MSGEFDTLTQDAATAIVTAIATGLVEAVKARLATVTRRERQIDATRDALAAAKTGSELDAVKRAEVRAWAASLQDFLDDNPGAAQALRDLLGYLAAGGAPAEPAPRSQSQRGGDGAVFAGRDIIGDVATSGGSIRKHRFQIFLPFFFLGHAAKQMATHWVVTTVTVVVVAGGVSAGIALTHKKPDAPAPTASASATTTARALPALSAAGWSQLHGDAARTGYQADETLIGAGNVSKLAQTGTYATNGNVTAPLIANGILYVATNRLYAFAAAGATGCSAAPATCTPLWTASTANFYGMTIAGGDIFVTDGEGVQAFDATGSENCTGTPKVCSPLWVTSTLFSPGLGSPAVANGVLYVPGTGDGAAPDVGGAYVAAFDASGKKGCSGTPTICVPMWTTIGVPASTGNPGSPAVAGGVLYIADGSLYAFDAAGSASCTGTPKTCAPLWTAAMPGGGPTTGAPAVADGMVYVATTYSGLYAFGAAGSANCSTGATGKTCAPLWNAPAPYSSEGTPAVANGVVYVTTTGGLAAFAAGAGSCPGTAAATTCTVAPLWTSATGGPTDSTSSPAVANGVVYVTGDGGIYGYDAAGSQHCSVSATAKTCSPLWSDVVGFTIGEAPALVNGTLYINVPGKEAAYAFSL